MTAQQKNKQPPNSENQERGAMEAVIGQHVIHTLGQPAHLQKVQVRPLWKDHYRVNVLVGTDASSVLIAHSFFLVADSAGTIIASTPLLRKQY